MSTALKRPLVAAQWDAVRLRFRDSLMVDTELDSLAQNLGISWPLPGRFEVPTKYLGLTFEELCGAPGFEGFPERVRLLHDILAETMAFDDPFLEMAEQVDSSSRKDDGPLRTLEKLGVPRDFPVALCAFTEDTRSFAELEGVETLGDFVALSQRLAENVVVGGEFRTFLNTLAHPDARTLARFLPVRANTSGVHLAEAVGQVFGGLAPAETAHLSRLHGLSLVAREGPAPAALNRPEWEACEARIGEALRARFAHFAEDYARLCDAAAEGPTALARFFSPLGDPPREELILAFVGPLLGVSSPESSGAPRPAKKGSWLARWWSRLRAR
jgi:hypothetical protein